MKMDGRDSAECQNWEKKDVNVIFGIVKLEKDKIINSICLLQNSKGENVKWSKGHSGGGNGVFRERTSDFSLKYREIRSSVVVGTRREVALH